ATDPESTVLMATPPNSTMTLPLATCVSLSTAPSTNTRPAELTVPMATAPGSNSRYPEVDTTVSMTVPPDSTTMSARYAPEATTVSPLTPSPDIASTCHPGMMMAIVIPLLIFPSVEKDAHWSGIFT